MKFLRTIRFDVSDTKVFAKAAEPGEWALPGGFLFAGATRDDLTGKVKQAFSNGFIALPSLGHSTFTSVVEISADETAMLKDSLATCFIEQYGAPTRDEARLAADLEIAFVLDLCRDVPINSIFTVHRFLDDAGEIKEEYRIVDAPGAKPHARVWDVVED